MDDSVKDGPPERALTVRWDGEDFQKIEMVRAYLNERDHADHTNTDVIRMGTRRFLDEVLANVAA